MVTFVDFTYKNWNIFIIALFEVCLCVNVMSLTTKCVSPTVSCDCFVDNGKKIINCRYRNLMAIPKFTNTNQIYDEIRFTSTEATGHCYPGTGCNSIRRIEGNDFAHLKVRKIDLRNNPITYVDEAAFSSLIPELESVLLEGDGSNDIPFQALARLDVYLKHLHLENYGSRAIQPPIVLPFPYLVSLTLENWPHLEYNDADIFRVMHNLEELRLIRLPALLSLPVTVIQKFVKLKTIDIMDTGIRSVFGGTFASLSELKEIRIHGNWHLNQIDQTAFHDVTDTVTSVDLDNNNLKNTEFLRSQYWPALRYLNIGYNRDVGILPAGIFSQVPSLEQLNCQDFGLTGVNEAMFTGLTNLRKLDLGYNQIGNIDTGAFRNLHSLAELYLNGQNIPNGIVNIKTNAFNGIGASLEILDFGNNKLDLNQFWDTLGTLENLKTLNLDNVGIVSVPDNAFGNNTKLEKLALSNNNISSLNQNTFYGPRNTLRTVDLHGNGIKSIDQCVFNDFLNTPVIILNGNPLVCDCGLVWLYDWMKTQTNQNVLSLNVGQCNSPKYLSGKFFSEFSRDELCPTGATPRVCPDVYLKLTTQPISPSSQLMTKPISLKSSPQHDIIITHVTSNSVQLTWMIIDKTNVTGLKLLISHNSNTETVYLRPDRLSYTFQSLMADTYYTVCFVLEVSSEFRDTESVCKQFKTVSITTMKLPGSTFIPTTLRHDVIVG